MNTHRKKWLVVISYYEKRPTEDLQQLLRSIRQFNAGVNFDVCLVINTAANEAVDYSSLADIVLKRPNVGMNIGAWDHAWREAKEYSNYLFLQDDCYVVRDNWLSTIGKRLQQAKVGLVGESFNESYAVEWEILKAREAKLTLPEHLINGERANRIDVYTHFLQQKNIALGPTARHLRALSWAMTRENLERVDGFPIGSNYGECIAAEIGVSRKIVSLGLTLETVADEPFHCVRHMEWNQSHPGREYSKLGNRDRQLKQLRDKNAQLIAQIKTLESLADASTWQQTRKALNGQLSQSIKHALRGVKEEN